MVDDALEEAYANPEDIGLKHKAWRVEDSNYSPKSSVEDYSPRNFERKTKYLKTDGEGVAPAN